VTPNRHGSAVFETVDDISVLVTRKFDAPIALVFDVLTKPEHVRNWISPFGCKTKDCEFDLRVGGNYHYSFVTENGAVCSFRGTFLEVEPPWRTVETWVFEARPHLPAVETVELHEADGVTTLTNKMTYRDKASRDEATQGGHEGVEDSFDKMEDLLTSLLGTVSE
jgi:uncharacterized protein YndB with AHSA1/START domain